MNYPEGKDTHERVICGGVWHTCEQTNTYTLSLSLTHILLRVVRNFLEDFQLIFSLCIS